MKHFLFNNKVCTKIIVIFAIITALVLVSIASVVFLLPYYNELQEKNQYLDLDQYREQINDDIPIKAQSIDLYFAKLKLTISLLDALQKDKPNENVFYSPRSVFQALLQIYFGAAGETEKELKHVLGLDWAKNKKDVADWYKLEEEKWYKRKNQLRNQTIEFMSAYKLYMADHIKISDLVKQAFNGSIEQLDFNHNANLSAKHINQFIEETTKNHIKDFLKQNTIEDAETVIVNAAYFKGHWYHPFEKFHTFPNTFYNQRGQPVDLFLMLQIIENHTGYGFIEHLKTQVLRMPYKGDNQTISMYVLLPENKPTAFDDILTKLTPGILNDIFDGVYFGVENVCVFFPKFSIEKEADLILATSRIGLQRLFDKYANYRGFYANSKGYKPLKIDLKHKTKIDVDDSQEQIPTVATKFERPHRTRAWAPPGSYIRATDIRCDRPFLFIIHDERLKEILFVGIFRGPNQ